jgi:hypothetical protein
MAEDVVHDVFAKVGPSIATLDDPVPYLPAADVGPWPSRDSDSPISCTDVGAAIRSVRDSARGVADVACVW